MAYKVFRQGEPPSQRDLQMLMDQGVIVASSTARPFAPHEGMLIYEIEILAEGRVACAANVPISTGPRTAPTLVGDMGECAYQLVMSDNIQVSSTPTRGWSRGKGCAWEEPIFRTIAARSATATPTCCSTP